MNYIKHIIKNITSRKLMIFKTLTILVFLQTVACTDELKLQEEPQIDDVEIEGDCIAFTLQLEKDISSRADYSDSYLEKYENYIDTQDKFRVFFFTAQGDFLFGANDRVVGNLNATSQSADASYYYVRIPMTMIVDRDNQEYDIEKIKNYLKNNPFKIAVLANWPNKDEKINPADWDDSDGTPDGMENPSSNLKGNPLWNWSNSILNLNAKPENIRNINDLHHVYKDLYYGDVNRQMVYGNFMASAKPGEEDGLYMGEPSDWVRMRDITDGGWRAPYPLSSKVSSFDTKATANQWIRANWSPEVTINQQKRIYRHYQHMWFLWNFDAAFKTGDKSGNIGYESIEGEIIKGTSVEKRKTDTKGNYIVKTVDNYEAYNDNWEWTDGYVPTETDPTNRFGKEWYIRNGDILYQWMKASYNNGETANAIGEKQIQIGSSNNDVYFKYQAETGKYAYCRKVGENYGIQLPAIGEGQRVTYNGTMQFQARTSGTLRIKWSSYDGTRSGLAVQVGIPKDAGENYTEAVSYKVHKGVTSTVPTDWSVDGLNYLDISVPEGSRTVYIWCTEGTAVVYSIEFIRGRYLYETDREGIAPNPNQGIPMYGVQNFDKISDWQRGTTFNLDKKISLIRALAKVEVHIKKAFGEPRHVYMRGMNRAARCEPIDVQTPTDRIWKKEHDYEKEHNTNNCEWFRIMDYGPAYGKVKDNEYANWLSWFYGSWKNKEFSQGEGYEPVTWKNNGVNVSYRRDQNKGYYVPTNTLTGWNQNSGIYGYSSSAPEPPHVFNPYMYRSDFCSFLKIDGNTTHANDAYYKYVLYVPEKNIDDPSTAGKMDSNPKVAHIEYRFWPKDAIDDEEEYDEGDIGTVFGADPYTNSEYNLDDNDCYRIYFTNYGSSTLGVNGPVNTELQNQNWWRYTYDDYEKSHERLQVHWPIMRNHIYKLYVGGAGPENPEIMIQVSDWSHRKVVVEW